MSSFQTILCWILMFLYEIIEPRICRYATRRDTCLLSPVFQCVRFGNCVIWEWNSLKLELTSDPQAAARSAYPEADALKALPYRSPRRGAEESASARPSPVRSRGAQRALKDKGWVSKDKDSLPYAVGLARSASGARSNHPDRLMHCPETKSAGLITELLKTQWETVQPKLLSRLAGRAGMEVDDLAPQLFRRPLFFRD